MPWGCTWTVLVVSLPLYWAYLFPWTHMLNWYRKDCKFLWSLMVTRTALKSLERFIFFLYPSLGGLISSLFGELEVEVEVLVL